MYFALHSVTVQCFDFVLSKEAKGKLINLFIRVPNMNATGKLI